MPSCISSLTIIGLTCALLCGNFIGVSITVKQSLEHSATLYDDLTFTFT